jgi:hypothetical protein
VLLLAPGFAQAKRISSITACGVAGSCSTVAVHGDAAAGLLPSGRGGGPPSRRVPFYRLKLSFGTGDHVDGYLYVLYAPSLKLTAIDERSVRLVWETVLPAARRVAERATRGLTPRPARGMPIKRAPRAAS